jgi:hypothetical protein
MVVLTILAALTLPAAAKDVWTGFSPDFQRFLRTAYPSGDFDGDGITSSFGGKTTPDELVRQRPVIFIHGNSDRAVDGPLGGWRASLNTFMTDRYRPAELYALT